jgi:uncharacterized HAD superfamily protein
MESDALVRIWTEQEVQQRELGLDPSDLSDVERRRLAVDLTMHMHEEVSELGRLSGGYKRHILRAADANLGDIAIECADILKTLVSLAQLHGVSREGLIEAFEAKTHVVRQKARAERIALTNECRVICVDIDDVICDLEPWREELRARGPVDAAAALRLEASEAMKASFYRGGRFRYMKPIAGAQVALTALRDAGFKVVLITARPQWQHKRLHSDTVHWLAHHRFQYDLLLFNRNKVEAIYEHVCPAWPVAFVEDHPSNAAALAEAGVPVFLYDQPHNQQVSAADGIVRVKDWLEILKRLGVQK